MQQIYLEIHHADSFKLPEKCFVFPVKYETYPFNIQMPLHIKCSDDDTLTINRTFMVDTGMPEDFVIMPETEEWSFFDKKQDAVWIF
ncbi:MAG: hypothetical protein LBT50_00430 [Prevotellaceae bacterium]|nr:hypothetical protein [Prevotellaceae bacterium]